MTRGAGLPTEAIRANDRIRTAGVRCPLGSVVDLSPTGLKVLSIDKPVVLVGHRLSFHIANEARSLDIPGQIIWIKRQARLRGAWAMGVQFDEQSSESRDAILSLAKACAAQTTTASNDSVNESGATVSADLEDLYEILGLPQSASLAQIRESFRTLAFRWHPDRCKEAGAPEAYDSVRRAHGILTDPASRRRYDHMYASARRAA